MATAQRASPRAAKLATKATKEAPLDFPLAKYDAKRDFTGTAEPEGKVTRGKAKTALGFVIQKHWASRLHYDFRLELDGVMVS